MAKQDLPPELHARMFKVRGHFVASVARLLQSKFPRLPTDFDLMGLVQELKIVSDDSLLEIAQEAYQAGLAKAGEAQQAVEDLETLRRAARILQGGAR